MKTSELQFNLPENLIAQNPVEPRDHCRLMVLDREKKNITHKHFYDLGQFLREGDVLVFNQSKVLPARLIGHVCGDGSLSMPSREVLLLKQLDAHTWQCLIGGKAKVGETVQFCEELSGEVISKEGGTAQIRFSVGGSDFMRLIHQIGYTPTPPYIKQFTGDPDLYQTVYANITGSAAAPTAGLHFTRRLLDELSEQGIQQEFVTLHVGLGTFQRIKTEEVEEHPIHSEYYEVDEDVLQRLKAAKQEGRRIIAVGTTSVRVLETIFGREVRATHTSTPLSTGASPVHLAGETNIFIYPGYKFKAVDALITNFHTPSSSLLALVYAFAGKKFIRKAYDEAIREEYRFYSFGDAMFVC